MLKVNPELTANKPTHIYNRQSVKVFWATKHNNTATAEIMEGNSKGKWITVYCDKLIPIDKDKGFSTTELLLAVVILGCTVLFTISIIILIMELFNT